jgi:sulfatase maturation enzyme AslB (radical SAM superfamily)
VKSDTFCLAPWVHSAVTVDTKLLPCCVSKPTHATAYHDYLSWWNGDEMSALRKDLVNGVKNTNCQTCWKSEELGKESLRQGYNKLFGPYTDFDLLRHNIINNNFQNIPLPTTWELDIGNLCNLKCIMCDPIRSNKILDEVLDTLSRYKDFPFINQKAKSVVQQNWIETDSGTHFLDLIRPQMKWLKIQGGEALTIKGIRNFIESMDGENITLAITTNGTVLDQRLLTALSRFKKVEISISVEAIGDANDVIRYGSNWETIKKNINLLNQQQNISVQLNHVLQNTSVLFLPHVLEFAEQNGLHLCLLPLTSPSYLSLSSIPLHHVDKLIHTIDSIDIKQPRNLAIKQYLKNVRKTIKYDPELHKQFQLYVSTLDSIREQKLTPQITPLL